MKLYKFTFKAIVAAPDFLQPEDLTQVTRSFKEQYSHQFLGSVLMDDVTIQLEPFYETTIS